MEGVMTVLADKQQALMGAIGITGVPTHRTSFARIAGIHLNCHRSIHESFVGDHGLQFSKGPFGVSSIGFPLFGTGLLPAFARCPFSNISQVLQTDQAMWMSGDNALGDYMISVLLQPSLSTANHDQTTCCGSSAFL